MTTPTELPVCLEGWEAITAENAAVTDDAEMKRLCVKTCRKFKNFEPKKGG